MAFGLTVDGFKAKRLQDIKSEIEASLRSKFGQNINLLPESNFGQEVAIYSERESLVWELAEAVYVSQYPSGAEGTSVDNILAYSGLVRLVATPTKTSESINGVPGLLLFGTPGTIIPKGSQISVSGSPLQQFTTDAAVTIGAAASAIQQLFFSSVPDSGVFTLRIVDPAGNTLTTPNISFDNLANQSRLTFVGASAAGSFKLNLTIAGVVSTTGFIATTAGLPTAASIQAAIVALSGYAGVTVAGSTGAGFTITWGAIPNPLLTVSNNTSGFTSITPQNSVQALVNNLHDVTAANYPYTDVTVAGSFPVGIQVNFGAGTVAPSQPVSSNVAQAAFTVPSNSLLTGATVVNVNVVDSQNGHPAQVEASAKATQNGPIFVPANTLTVIDTPVSGWSSVNNPLDCISGTNREDDTQALERRAALLASQANGPLEAIVAKVKSITAVTQVVGFQNQTQAAIQNITFSAIPTSGTFRLNIGGLQTAAINWNDTAANVQTKIRALTGYGTVLVTGNFQFGFNVDFNGATGGQPQDLVTVSNNSLSNGSPVTPTVAFGRPGKAIEIVVKGGLDIDIAAAIYKSAPAGIETYGNTSAIYTNNLGQQFTVFFSRPSSVTIYVAITLVTSNLFPSDGAQKIQQELVNIVNKLNIGENVTVFGTAGLVGGFNDVDGILSYTLAADTVASPTNTSPIQLQPYQLAVLETFNIIITVT